MTENEIPGEIPGIFGFCTLKRNANVRKICYSYYMGKYNARFSDHGRGAGKSQINLST